MDSVNMSELESINDYPDNTKFVLDDVSPRYVLEPFEIILPSDPRYKDAFTREQINEITEK